MTYTTACPRYEVDEIPCEHTWVWDVVGGLCTLRHRFCDHAIDPVMDCLSRADAYDLAQLDTSAAA